ncbi:hypothetical protein N207_04295 [Helicobacter pylori UM114]|uniref:Uncharacterized protein n=1 Tax=Helicobacter pylori UM114 TaxID=1355531 RepID=T0ERZ9_HELPX|nr:hypothetical protein N207_04295 [Helicobacter pylori UM114]
MDFLYSMFCLILHYKLNLRFQKRIGHGIL